MNVRLPARGPFPVLSDANAPLVDTSGLDTGLLALQGLGIAFVGSVVAVLLTWWLVWFAVVAAVAISVLRYSGRRQTLIVGERGLSLGFRRWSWGDVSGLSAGTTVWLEDEAGREVERREPSLLFAVPGGPIALWLAEPDVERALQAARQNAPARLFPDRRVTHTARSEP